jgi:heme a synthase
MNAAAAHTFPAVTVRRQPLLPRYAWGVVAWNVLVVLWGALVRATGSGAGCGNHWPLCNGQVIPQSPQIATVIEFTHRMMTGGSTFAVLGLLIWTFRSTPRRHLARVAAVASTLLLLNEAFLGALLVKLGYVVQSQSPGRFVVLPIHLANTLLLLAALTLTAHFLSRQAGFMRGSVDFVWRGTASIGLLVTLMVGVTGSLAALGDTLFPATSLRAAVAQDFAASSMWILHYRWTHPALGFAAGMLIIGLIYHAVTNPRHRTLAMTVIALLFLQYALGLLDIALLAPTWLQIVHLLGADLLWIALIVLTARLTIVPVGCTEFSCRAR